MSEPNPFRLPRAVVPSRYELTLEPDLDAATFGGRATAEVEVIEPTEAIVLNALELEIDEAWIQAPEGGRTELAVDIDEETERATLTASGPIEPGRWFVHTRFRGVLNDKLRGFYRSTFTGDDDVERAIATTQFEATDARRAFPCWDEPDFKAVFSVTLVVAPDLLAVSNASELSRETLDDGRVAVHFADTIRMSTYLVAFVVGPLEVTAPVMVNGTALRVIHAPGKAHLTPFALEVGEFALRFFADYYGIVYPVDTLDLIAVPDFAFGAMENLGAVTFREVLILVDPEASTQAELERVVDVISHELAHMWFGDLVTMRWWNGIWLNEAFATFMEMLATDAFRPEWERWVTFGLSRTAAFDVDALASTRPIEFEVVSPDEAEGMFDILTYEKGAAVVRMLEQYLGADRFREGISLYLRQHQFDNTETTDLWDALESATSEPTRRIMDSWILQGGFPLLTVDLVDDGSTVCISQRPFRYLDAEDDGTRWAVPVIFSQERDGAVEFERVLLEGDSVDVSLWEQVEWILANTEGTGFYRVQYAPDLLAALTAHLDQLSPIERYTLVDDQWASSLASLSSVHDFVRLADNYADETDLSVWQRLVGAFGSLDRIAEGPVRDDLRGFIRGMVEPALFRLGRHRRDGDDDRTRQLRGVLFETLGVLAHDEVTVEQARTMLQQDPDEIDPAMLASAINTVAAHGSIDDYERFVDGFRNAPTPQQELRYLSALADFPDPTLMQRTLEMTLTDDVRTQNAPYLLRRSITNRDLGPIAWAFVKESWTAINDRFPSNSIVRMLEGIRSLSDDDTSDDVFAFFSEHQVPQGDRVLAQHLERLQVNVALRQREAPHIGEAFG